MEWGGSEPTKVISSAGIYTVIVTSQSGCTASSSINVIQDTGIPDISASNDALRLMFKNFCFIDSIAISRCVSPGQGGGTNQTKSVSKCRNLYSYN
ncbi:MAG: hypothetical protein IPO98_05190 [Saprospiraceae bacterium]|nr:hypothetical protein [Saprospiraceae bacterium]